MSLSSIPNTAPFSEDEIAILNRVIAPATPIQRAWLAGFLTGLDAAAGVQPQTAAPPKASEPLTILFATNPEIRRSLPPTPPRPRARRASSRPSSISRI